MKSKNTMLASIALTTSKSEFYIQEQIDSLLNQTYKNIEIIISHDECGDNTIHIIKEYSNTHKNIKYYINSKPKGYVGNNENAIEHCTGDIIFLCDHDDYWYPEKVESHMNAYKDKSVCWAYNKVVITDKDNKKEIGKIEDEHPTYYRHKTDLENAWGSCIGGAMSSYRSNILKKTLPFPSYVHAHDSWIQFVIYPKKAFFIDTVLQKYRQHGNNAVGYDVSKTESDEIIKKREILAIKNNIFFIRKVLTNNLIPMYRRVFLFFIYLGKIIKYNSKLKVSDN